MICKKCLRDMQEKDFPFSCGKYEGNCYHCIYEMKVALAKESKRTDQPKEETRVCKSCKLEFSIYKENSNYLSKSKYCSDTCRKKAAMECPSNKERRKLPTSWSFSWKSQNFCFKRV